MVRETPILGLSERWSLSRNNIKSPITVIYHASLSAGLVTEDELKDAAAVLCKTYPILLCGVEGRYTRTPKYVHRGDVISTRKLVKVVDLEEEVSLSELVENAVLEGKQLDVSLGPLWEIQLQRISSPSSSSPRDRIVLLIDHILCDGVGARNLFADLLGLLSGEPIPSQPEGLPSRMDDTVDLRGNEETSTIWSYLQSYIIPLTSRLTALFSPSPVYPNFPPRQPLEYNSITASQQFSEFSLSSVELSALLAEGKKHGIPTIHPVIHIATLIALYRTANPSSGSSFYSSIPISERKAESGHPRSTGNYVTFGFSTDNIDASTRFWDHARGFSSVLRDPETKIIARKTLGKLASIDSAKTSKDESSGWEAYLNKLIKDPSGSHKLSLAVSNVGFMEVPTKGKLVGQVDDVYFTQSASAMGACAVVSIMTARGGAMTASISSKIGSLPPRVFESFSQQLKPILQAIARGEVGEDCTAGSSIAGVIDYKSSGIPAI